MKPRLYNSKGCACNHVRVDPVMTGGMYSPHRQRESCSEGQGVHGSSTGDLNAEKRGDFSAGSLNFGSPDT